MILTTLKKLFAGFIRTRSIGRHFRRIALLDSLARTGISREAPPTLSQTLIAAAKSDPHLLLAQLDSSACGLSMEQAATLQERFGLNEIEQDKSLSWWQHLWHCYKTPFDFLLTLLAIIAFITNDLKTTFVISTMVLLSVSIRFLQESTSNRAADKLKAMVSNTATVIRHDPEKTEATHCYLDFQNHLQGSAKKELPIKQLVPGDLVLLSAGDMIPGDCRVLIAKDLFVSQAAMTGEALPIEKFVVQRDLNMTNPLELENILFMGTNVVSGAATAVILSTGKKTYFGTLAQRVIATDGTPSQFQNGVNNIAWLLIRFMLIMAPLVLFINGFTKGNWTQACLFAMSIAVGLTPEMLPMIVTSTLAKGAINLSRKKVIVKRLDAIQTFGAMNILCTDKTGTLTQDKIFLSHHTDVWGQESDEVLEAAYLNSYYQTGLKNLLDLAVLEHAEIKRELNINTAFRKIDEIPFDFTRRRMSVVVAEHEKHHILICKGAAEEILSICTNVRHGEHTEPLTDELLERVRTITADLNEDGLRVVAVASKEMPPTQETYGVCDESELTLIGYVAFLDPPKESTAPALQGLAAHGVTVKVLTGDNELVTSKICREVGLEIGAILLGSDLEKMNDQALSQAVESHHVFAKLTPIQKERIVRSLKENGNVVGFLGDGINDAAALRAADIGISVDTAVDIAKEAADIIMLEKSLMILEAGVLEGRKTFSNIIKYIKMTASSNFGNVFSVLIASAFLPFLPMLPIHILVQNLLYDISQIAIPFDNVDAELIKKPRRWNAPEIGRFMVCFGPISSIFDITTYCMMWYLFQANTPTQQTLFQSGWFMEGLMTQILIVHMIRTQKIPFFQSRPSATLVAMSAIVIAIGIFLPMGPLAHYFKLEALPLVYFPLLAAILLSYMLLTQVIKYFYIKRYGWQ